MELKYETYARRTVMTTEIQPRISEIRQQAASSALSLVIVLVAVVAAAAQSKPVAKFTNLHAFNGTDGNFPYGPVMQDVKGNIYGTTFFGGTSSSGTVFKLGMGGKLTSLYNFTGGNDGAYPYAGLAQDSVGNSYGTTANGGDSSCGGGGGCGTVFKLSRSGKLTVLHTFEDTDGAFPEAGVTLDAAGNIYGITLGGGTAGYGTVFKLEKSGKETVLHSFTGTSGDGQYPANWGFLVLDAKGNLYGTAQWGGDLTCNAPAGCGIVFKLNKDGKVTVLHTFEGGKDGEVPVGGLIQDAAGNLYGATYGNDQGNCTSSFGTVFKLDTKGKQTVLYNFSGGKDGACPSGGVVLDSSGNLYGTTTAGGASGYGTVFKLAKNGKETVLHSFGNYGRMPEVGLFINAAGTLYGTTLTGAAYQYGTVFRVSP
jgi:uncharacterized repeat protein (TIGR03803 family)